MRRPVVVLLTAAAFVVTAVWWTAERAVTPDDLLAVGLDGFWESPDWPAWTPRFLKQSFPQGRLRTVWSESETWHPGADRLVAKLPPVDEWILEGTAVPEASVRRLVASQRGLSVLALEDAEVPPGLLAEILPLPSLRVLHVDSASLSDADLIAAAGDCRAGLMDATLCRRLARRFCGVPIDLKAGQREAWRHASFESRSTGKVTAAPALAGPTRTGTVDWENDPTFKLSLWQERPETGGDAPPLSEECRRLLSAVRGELWAEFSGVTIAPPAGEAAAWLRYSTLSLSPARADDLRALDASRSLEALELSDWRDGDAPLGDLAFPQLTRLEVTQKSGVPLSGRFLASARLPDLTSLTVRSADVAEEVATVDFSRFPKLEYVNLDGVTLDAASLRTLPRGLMFNANRLPAVPDRDLARAARAVQADRRLLGPDARPSGATLAALIEGTDDAVIVHAKSLPPAEDLGPVAALLSRPGQTVTLHIDVEHGSNDAARWLQKNAPQSKLKRPLVR